MDVIFALKDIETAADAVIRALEKSEGKVIAFHGEMGAGKTTLIHAICKRLNVNDNITSPTFSIINEYKSGSNEIIFHIDLYRLRDAAEARDAGIEDCFYSGNRCFVEWPERAAALLPENTLHCNIMQAADNTRKLQINL